MYFFFPNEETKAQRSERTQRHLAGKRQGQDLNPHVRPETQALSPCTLSTLPPGNCVGPRPSRRPYLVQGNDEEGPPTGALSHDCNEIGVHSAEVIVLDAVGDGHRIVAVLLAGWFAKDVAELGAPVLGMP